jgi:hypothetical protein
MLLVTRYRSGGNFCFVVLHSSTYLFTVGVEVVLFSLDHTQTRTPQSLGLLWMRDRPVAETSTWQHKHCTGDEHPCARWDSNPRSQQALGRRPTPQTTRPLGSAETFVIGHYITVFEELNAHSPYIPKSCAAPHVSAAPKHVGTCLHIQGQATCEYVYSSSQKTWFFNNAAAETWDRAVFTNSVFQGHVNHLYKPVNIKLTPGLFSSVPPIFAHILQTLMIEKSTHNCNLICRSCKRVHKSRSANGPNWKQARVAGTRVLAVEVLLMKRHEQIVGACLLRNLNVVIQLTVLVCCKLDQQYMAFYFYTNYTKGQRNFVAVKNTDRSCHRLWNVHILRPFEHWDLASESPPVTLFVSSAVHEEVQRRNHSKISVYNGLSEILDASETVEGSRKESKKKMPRNSLWHTNTWSPLSTAACCL